MSHVYSFYKPFRENSTSWQETQPLSDLKIDVCVHITSKQAYKVLPLCNPMKLICANAFHQNLYPERLIMLNGVLNGRTVSSLIPPKSA